MWVLHGAGGALPKKGAGGGGDLAQGLGPGRGGTRSGALWGVVLAKAETCGQYLHFVKRACDGHQRDLVPVFTELCHFDPPLVHGLQEVGVHPHSFPGDACAQHWGPHQRVHRARQITASKHERGGALCVG